MLPKDRQLIQKLKRRISLLIIVCLGLGYWIRLNYLQIESHKYEVESLTIDLIDSESRIKNLNSKLDSLNKRQIQAIQKPKNLINKKKIITEKKDSVIPQKVDSLSKIVIDTISK